MLSCWQLPSHLNIVFKDNGQQHADLGQNQDEHKDNDAHMDDSNEDEPDEEEEASLGGCNKPFCSKGEHDKGPAKEKLGRTEIQIFPVRMFLSGRPEIRIFLVWTPENPDFPWISRGKT